jgi:hypothetical protein
MNSSKGFQGDPADVAADLATAKEHLLKSSCTEPGDDGVLKWRSLWKASVKDMGTYGVGIQLYFEFLFTMGFIFMFMGFLTMPLLVANGSGDMAGESAPALAKLSLGNLGICGKYMKNCTNIVQEADRNLWGPEAGGQKVREATAMFGGLDMGAILLYLLVLFFFYTIRINRVMKAQDEANITPADFTVRVDNLPQRLKNKKASKEENDALHKEYEAKLKEHFLKVLFNKKFGMPEWENSEEKDGTGELVGGSNAIQDITLVRNYNGAVGKFMGIGKILKERKNLEQKVAALKNPEGVPAFAKKKPANPQAEAAKTEVKIKKLETKMAVQLYNMSRERSQFPDPGR